MKQTVILPYPPAILNPNDTHGFREKARAKKAYKQLCMWECIAQKLKKMRGPLKVRIVISYPDNRKRDFDNAIAAFKSGQDGIATQIGVDDSEWTTKYKKGDGPGGIVVTLKEIVT